MERKLRWGIVGTANIGRRAVLPAIRASSNGELAAVASRSAEKAKAFAAENGIPRAYASYEELLAAEDVDAVYIPLPNSMHCEWTVKAAQAGKHVLCEKPLALNAAECEEMERAAQATGVKLMEAFMYRFHPQTAKVLELIAAGAIGELRLIRSAFAFRVTNPANIRLQPDLGGGSLMDVGCYCVNISRTLARSEPVTAIALSRQAATGVDEEMFGMLEFPDSVVAQFDSGLGMERREFYEVAGTEGSLYVPAAFLPGTADTTIYERHGRGGETVHTLPGVDEYRLMVEHFADCALNDRRLRYPAAGAAANMRAIDALQRSARAGGRPEPIAPA